MLKRSTLDLLLLLLPVRQPWAVTEQFAGRQTAQQLPNVLPQIHAMYDVFPDRLHAYKYIFVSVGAAWVAGVVIYGAPAWAHM